MNESGVPTGRQRSDGIRSAITSRRNDNVGASLRPANDQALVQRTVAALKAQLGDAKFVQVPPITASGDFSEFAAEGVPTMFFFVGVSDPKNVTESQKPGGKPLPFNHSPYCAPVPEPSITTGGRAMTAAVLSALGTKS